VYTSLDRCQLYAKVHISKSPPLPLPFFSLAAISVHFFSSSSFFWHPVKKGKCWKKATRNSRNFRCSRTKKCGEKSKYVDGAKRETLGIVVCHSYGLRSKASTIRGRGPYPYRCIHIAYPISHVLPACVCVCVCPIVCVCVCVNVCVCVCVSVCVCVCGVRVGVCVCVCVLG